MKRILIIGLLPPQQNQITAAGDWDLRFADKANRRLWAQVSGADIVIINSKFCSHKLWEIVKSKRPKVFSGGVTGLKRLLEKGTL